MDPVFDEARARGGRSPTLDRAQADAAPLALRIPAEHAGRAELVRAQPRLALVLQRTVGNAAVSQLIGGEDLESVRGAVSDGGIPLDVDTRRDLEVSLGADFSDVRVHTGEAADRSSRGLGAHAYTVGSDVVFAAGHFDTGTLAGRRTLAHELAHVVQQRTGPVEGTPTGGGISLSDPSDRYERAADAAAERVTAGRSADVAPGAPTGVQREEDVESLEVETLD